MTIQSYTGPTQLMMKVNVEGTMQMLRLHLIKIKLILYMAIVAQLALGSGWARKVRVPAVRVALGIGWARKVQMPAVRVALSSGWARKVRMSAVKVADRGICMYGGYGSAFLKRSHWAVRGCTICNFKRLL
jgi:hypothetical protein